MAYHQRRKRQRPGSYPTRASFCVATRSVSSAKTPTSCRPVVERAPPRHRAPPPSRPFPPPFPVPTASPPT